MHQADPFVEDVDDGIKSERVSIAGEDGIEYEEDDHEEGEIEHDHSKLHLGQE